MNSLATTEALLDQIFDIQPLGIFLKSSEPPKEEAFETLLYYLGAKQDELRWKIAAACNLYNRFYRKFAYEKAASILELSPSTIETWAHIERNVPYEVRRPEKSIWFHKLVTKLPVNLQSEYLNYCIEHDLSHSRFERWLIKQQNADLPPVVYRSDRLHELEQENYNLINENLDLKQRLNNNDNKLETSQVSDHNKLVRYIITAIDRLAEIYPAGIEAIRRHLETL